MFYETLARYYDLVFPTEKSKVDFLDRLFQKSGAVTILDVACGTGNYALALAKRGYTVLGIDLSEKMIELAAKKAEAEKVNAMFAVADMRNLAELGRVFGGLFCIGNSLSHFADEKELRAGLAGMRRVLATGGYAVFQVVNYDRILKEGDTVLPLIERSGLRFERVYRPVDEKRLYFDSVLTVQEDGREPESYENRVVLLPITGQMLASSLEASGFRNIELYGSFGQEPYSLESKALVAVAQA